VAAMVARPERLPVEWQPLGGGETARHPTPVACRRGDCAPGFAHPTPAHGGPPKVGRPGTCKLFPRLRRWLRRTAPIERANRLGRIRAAVWLNDTENGPRYNVQITRLYKDKQDKWQDSTSFGREDLPLVAKVADLAMVWVYENPAGSEK